MRRWGRGQAMRAVLTLAGGVVVVAGLSLGRDLLAPLAMAVLLTFLLAPLANRLENLRVPRIPAVLIVCALAFALIAAVGYVVVRQSIDLVWSLPHYRQNIDERVESVRGQADAWLQWVSRPLRQFRFMRRPVVEDATPVAPPGIAIAPPPASIARPPDPPRGSEDNPMVVRPLEPPLSPVGLFSDYVGAVLSPLLTGAIVVVFVIFMLIQRDDLRDRIIRLVGQRRIHITTHAISDAGERISRYLLMQLVINMTYGIPVAVGLWFIGLPGAVLWGLLATTLRFIPYLGPWLAASMPIALSLAVFPGWIQPIIVIGLFVGLELFSNNVMEPWLYGSSTGMSATAVLLAAAFWSWLWGPVGLLLAVPITACLVVAGRYIPSLRFLAVMLGDKLALDPHVRLYQQLAEMDDHEPLQLVREYAREHSRLELYDDLVLPALHLTEQERHRGWIEPQRQQFIRRSIQQMVEQHATVKIPQSNGEQGPVVCVAARDVADSLSAMMLADLLRSADIAAVSVTRTQLLSGGKTTPHDTPPIVVISAMPPSAAQAAADLLRALRQVQPDCRVIVGLWGRRLRTARARRALRREGALTVVTSFGRALERIDRDVNGSRQESP